MQAREVFALPPLRCELSQVRDVLSALLHTIVFARALGCCAPRDARCERVDVHYVTCGDGAVDGKIEEKINALVRWALKTGGGEADVAVSFYERERDKPRRGGALREALSGGRTRREEARAANGYWEQWRIGLEIFRGEELDETERARALRLVQLLTPKNLQSDPPLFPVPIRRARFLPSRSSAAQRLSQRAAASRLVPLALVKAHRHVRLPASRLQRPSHEGVYLLLYLPVHRAVAARDVVHVHALASRVPRRAASERAREDDRVQQRREHVAHLRQLASQRRQREHLPRLHARARRRAPRCAVAARSHRDSVARAA